MDVINIPRTLDEKDRILFFTVQEILAFLGGFGIGIVFKVPVMGLAFGGGLFFFARWIKRQGYADVIANYLYWYVPTHRMGLLSYKLEGTPPSAIKQWTG